MFSQYALGRLTAIQYASTGPSLQFTDMYSYTPGGLPNKKRLQMNQAMTWMNGPYNQYSGTRTLNLDASYGWDSEGRVTSVTYPSTTTLSADYYPVQQPVAGPNYTYGFDSMHRPSTLTNEVSAQVVGGIQYGPANELLALNATFNASSTYESRTYNAMLQMTDLKVGSYSGGTNLINLHYTFSATQNNGKITMQKDYISGEEVQYTYDTLNRLITAATTAASDAAGIAPWGQSYGFDPFGNLGNKTVTKGSGPSLAMSMDPYNNQIYGQTYDANGNLLTLPNGGTATYDAENRLVAANGMRYGYDAGNRRIWKWAGATDANFGYSSSNANGVEIYFYGVDGRRLGTYVSGIFYVNTQYWGTTITGPALTDRSPDVNVYFGGKLVARGSYTDSQTNALAAFYTDRLGSAVKTYPYGEEKQPNGADGYKFATYWRDTNEGNLDYAMNRYYTSQWGRFLTPDPYVSSGGVTNPTGWNRYAYVEGNPVNYGDPNGRSRCMPGVSWGIVSYWTGESWAYSILLLSSWGTDSCGPDASGGAAPLPQVPGTPDEHGGDRSGYTAGLFSALDALTDPECAGLFNVNGTGKYSPRDVLAAMALGGVPPGLPQGSYFGSVRFAPMRLDFAGVTQPDPKTTVSTGAGIKAASADIVLQSNRLSEFYYNTQSAQDLALTLIHELGHVYNIVSGLGGSKIVNDVNPDGSPNRDAEDANEKTIQKCNPK